MCSVALTNWEVPTLVTISVIGFLVLTQQTLKFINFVWSMFIRSPKNLTNYGSWALITGCTDGIGKAISFELASKGLNLVLVGRNILKLEATSDEILEKYGKDKIQIKSVIIDFAKVSGDEIERKIKEEIEGLDVGVLVNNVGIASQVLKFFHKVDLEVVNEMVNVNIRSVTWVTKAVLPGMIRKKKGVVVNIGSGSTIAAPSFPFATLYAATKGYMLMFSRSLSVEYQKYGIDVQCQTPMFVATKMLPKELPGCFGTSPEKYAKSSIRWFGHGFMCVPLWTQAVQVYLSRAVPGSLANWVLINYCLYVRKKSGIGRH